MRPTITRCTTEKGRTLVTYDATNRLYVAMPGGKISSYSKTAGGVDQLYAFTC